MASSSSSSTEGTGSGQSHVLPVAFLSATDGTSLGYTTTCTDPESDEHPLQAGPAVGAHRSATPERSRCRDPEDVVILKNRRRDQLSPYPRGRVSLTGGATRRSGDGSARPIRGREGESSGYDGEPDLPIGPQFEPPMKVQVTGEATLLPPEGTTISGPSTWVAPQIKERMRALSLASLMDRCQQMLTNS